MQLIKAMICQLTAVGLLWFSTKQYPQIPLGLAWLLPTQAVLAALFSVLLKQAIWWRFIHLLFMPAVVASLLLKLPAWWYLLIFLALLLIFWGTVKGDVPLFLSSPRVTQALANIAQQQRAHSLIELGAGIGSVVVPLAKQLPNLQVTAVEYAPLPWLILAWRCRNLPNVVVKRCSLWTCDLAGFDLAYAFLSPLVMPQLADKVQAEMRQGWLISSSFIVPNWKTQQSRQLDDNRQTCLYLYRLPRKA